MYATSNPKTKKHLRELVAAGANYGVAAFQPGPFGPDVADGWHTCEGPHYPQPHRWYARVRVVGGCIVEVSK